MNTSATQSYNVMLQSLLFNITPALPAGAGGTREPVGEPEHIPEKTFITREVKEEDNIEPPDDDNDMNPDEYRDELNDFILDGIQYHQLYGLIPDDASSSNDFIIGSVEEILEHYSASSDIIERIRLVSHGNDSFLFVPLFKNGSWNIGINEDWLEAFQTSDEDGLRFIISNNPEKSPLFPDNVVDIVKGLRILNDEILTPFGLEEDGQPTGIVMRFFEVINDQYQVQNGTVLSLHGDNTLIDENQQSDIDTALQLIENEVKEDIEDSDELDITITEMESLKTTVMEATPKELRFFGEDVDLDENVIDNLTEAMNRDPVEEDDLRDAFPTNIQQMFPNNTDRIIFGLKVFHEELTLGGDSLHDIVFSDLDQNMLEFVFICNHLFFLNHGKISIGDNYISDNTQQEETLRDGLHQIADFIAGRINDNTAITNQELSEFRNSVEGLTARQTISNDVGYVRSDITSILPPANDAIEAGFRDKIDHFRTLINSDSNIDIRGCLIGKSPEYLNDLRNFFGTAGSILDNDKLPNISAPDWYQSFPLILRDGGVGTPIFDDIDDMLQNGLPSAHISSADVADSFSAWMNLIDFNPHFSFIKVLFDGTTSKFDFATLEWNSWRSSGSTTGIPILSMEAERIDDLTDLNLGEVIERFRVIFDIPSGSAPNTVERTQLDDLQPHMVTFKSLKDTVDSAGSPNSEQLTEFFNDVSTLANDITSISGMPAPSSPSLVPSSVPSPLELSDIETYISDIKTYIDDYLDGTCGTFFTAVFDPGSDNGALQHSNAENRYYLNIGLPLLLKNSVDPNHAPSSLVCSYMSATSNSQPANQIARALRSWMKIQWTGSTAQVTAMNTHIDNVSIDDEGLAATHVSMLTDKDPSEDGAEAEINPMPGFEEHIVKRPII